MVTGVNGAAGWGAVAGSCWRVQPVPASRVPSSATRPSRVGRVVARSRGINVPPAPPPRATGEAWVTANVLLLQIAQGFLPQDPFDCQGDQFKGVPFGGGHHLQGVTGDVDAV